MFDFFMNRRRITSAEREAQGRNIVAAQDGFASWFLGLFGIVGKTEAQRRREAEEIAQMLGEDPDIARRKRED